MEIQAWAFQLTNNSSQGSKAVHRMTFAYMIVMHKWLEKWLSEFTVCKQADIVLLIQLFVIRSQQLIAALAIEEQKKISVTSHWFLMHLWSMFSDKLL